MSFIFSYLLSCKYPQHIWASEISTFIKKLGLEETFENVYDAPGGVGFISYGLLQNFRKKYYVFDIDDVKLDCGRKAFNRTSIEFQNKDIYTTKFKKKSLWLLINSLYLLDNLEIVLSNNAECLQHIIGIFPYTNAKNYLHFKKNIDPDLNSNEMTKTQTIEFFNSNNYELIGEKDTTYFSYLRLSHIPIIKHLAALIFTYLEKYLKLKGQQYWIGVFKRKEKPSS